MLVAKVGSYSLPWFFSGIQNSSRVTKVVLAVLAFVAFAVVVKRLWSKDSTGGAERSSAGNDPIVIPPDDEVGNRSEFYTELKGVLDRSGGFDSLPILEVDQVESYELSYEEKPKLPPLYLEVDPQKMSDRIMRGKDGSGREFVAYRYCKKDNQPSKPLEVLSIDKTSSHRIRAWEALPSDARVDIFFRREKNRWYMNDERSEASKLSLAFLTKLLADAHPLYQLC